MDKTWIKSKRQTKNEFKYDTKDDVSIFTDGIGGPWSKASRDNPFKYP